MGKLVEIFVCVADLYVKGQVQHEALSELNLNQFCVSALFMNKTNVTDSYYMTKVRLDTVLPMAKYITDGVWVLSIKEKLQLSISCHDQPVTFRSVEPPLALIRLNMTCTATSDSLMLPPYYQSETEYLLEDTKLKLLKVYAFSNLTLWEPFHKALPAYKFVQLPEKLKEVNEIPMDHLIRTLSSLNARNKEKGWSWWVYLSLITAGISGLGAVGTIVYFCYIKRRGTWLRSLLSRLRLWGKRIEDPTSPTLLAAASANSHSHKHVTTQERSKGNDGTAAELVPMVPVHTGGGVTAPGEGTLSTPVKREATVNLVRQLYPGLDLATS